MFSGRWEQNVDQDADGRIFLDFDPYCFQQILSYLRSCKIRRLAVAPASLQRIKAKKLCDYLELVK